VNIFYGARKKAAHWRAERTLLLRVSAEKQNEYEGQQESEDHECGNIVCR
jgi:hypothetical protein